MKELPKVRVIRAFGQFRVGAVIQPTGLYRDSLIAAGLVEMIKPQQVGEVVASIVQPEVKLPRSSRRKHKVV